MPYVLAASAVAIAAVAAIVRTQPPAPHPLQMTLAPVGAVARSAPSVAGDRVGRGARETRPQERVVVYVTGEVNRPGVYALGAGSRVESAVHAAGGPSAKADLVAVNLAEPLSDGEQVVVPAHGQSRLALSSAVAPALTAPRHGHRTSAGSHHRGRRSHKAPPSSPIDVNAADASQLEELPGIGPSLAERIVAFRELNGPFHSADELLDVAGMTDRRLDAIADYIVVR